jgi:hypothetical protein
MVHSLIDHSWFVSITLSLSLSLSLSFSNPMQNRILFILSSTMNDPLWVVWGSNIFSHLLHTWGPVMKTIHKRVPSFLSLSIGLFQKWPWLSWLKPRGLQEIVLYHGFLGHWQKTLFSFFSIPICRSKKTKGGRRKGMSWNQILKNCLEICMSSEVENKLGGKVGSMALGQACYQMLRLPQVGPLYW